MPYDIELKTVAARPIAAVKFRARIADLPQHMGQAFGAVMEYLGRAGVQPSGPAVSLYHQLDDGEFEVAAGFYVAPAVAGDGYVVPVELPAGDVATTTHIGSYEGLMRAYEAIQAWMQQHGRAGIDDTMWEEYFSGPEAPPEETRTVVYWLLKPQ